MPAEHKRRPAPDSRRRLQVRRHIRHRLAVGRLDVGRHLPPSRLLGDLDQQGVGPFFQSDRNAILLRSVGPRLGEPVDFLSVEPHHGPVVGAERQHDVALVGRLEIREGIRHGIRYTALKHAVKVHDELAGHIATRLALEGTPYQGLSDLFVGPTAIAYSDDPVAAAKASADFAKGNDRLVILGGALGDKALDADGVKALASLPSLDELRGMIVGLLNAPATRVAGVLAAPGGQLARVLAAHGAAEDAA